MKRTIGEFFDYASRRMGTFRFASQGTRQSAAFEHDRSVARLFAAPTLPRRQNPFRKAYGVVPDACFSRPRQAALQRNAICYPSSISQVR
jgi:hypothetical protein